MAEKTKKILIADDETDVHVFLRVALEQDGREIITASDGQEALEKAKAELPDLIILDVQMPGKDGFEVFSALSGYKATESIPVIMLTGVSDRTGIKFSASDMGEYLGKEPAVYIEKPIDPAVIQETVTGLLV